VRSAYRGALVAALLNALGSPLQIAVATRVPYVPGWPPLVSSATGALVAAALLLRRRAMTVRFAAAAFVVNNAVIVFSLWITNDYFARSAPLWIPFQANKLGCLAAAMLAPDRWSGVAVIAAFAGSAMTQYLLWSPSLQQRVPVGEPWTSVIYGAFGLVILVVILRRRASELAVVGARAETAALERFARKLLAIRDLTNTPIQTIELTSALLRRKRADLVGELDRIDRALSRLREMNQLLAGLESSERWPRTLESFDAREHLK
jgi:hypothetical protein